MKRKLLITGASGFLGAHLVVQASEKWETTAIYRTNKYSFPGQWIQADLTNYSLIHSIVSQIRPQVIIHCAATADLEAAERQPELAYETNILVTRNLTEICEQFKIRFIFISSDMVFDGETGLYSEEDVPNPLNYYGRTKLEAEEYIRMTSENYVIARSALIYGLTRSAGLSFCEIMLQNWNAQKPVTLFNDQYRSPILVDNLAAALLEIADLDYVGTLHLGGSQRLSRLEFGIIFAKLFTVPSHLIVSRSMLDIKFQAKRPADTSYDISLARSLLETKLMDCLEGAHYFYKQSFQTT